MFITFKWAITLWQDQSQTQAWCRCRVLEFFSTKNIPVWIKRFILCKTRWRQIVKRQHVKCTGHETYIWHMCTRDPQTGNFLHEFAVNFYHLDSSQRRWKVTLGQGWIILAPWCGFKVLSLQPLRIREPLLWRAACRWCISEPPPNSDF